MKIKTQLVKIIAEDKLSSVESKENPTCLSTMLRLFPFSSTPVLYLQLVSPLPNYLYIRKKSLEISKIARKTEIAFYRMLFFGNY